MEVTNPMVPSERVEPVNLAKHRHASNENTLPWER